MGFFKEFKDDLMEAVDDMIPTEDAGKSDDGMVNTLTDNVDVGGELNKLDGLLEMASQKVESEVNNIRNSIEEESVNNNSSNTGSLDTYVSRSPYDVSTSSHTMDTTPTFSTQPASSSVPASDENAIITAGMTVTGDLDSAGSIEVEGRVNGNIRCNGKLTVTGMISGNSSASEVFADSARIDGEINASGTVKVGSGSVVVGNISATSAVIAGAVKGDIDVKGPVVIDTSAVVMGNVKSRTVQINNGAVIEGFCSQAYSETDVGAVFE